MINEWSSRLENLRILLSRNLPEIPGANFRRSLADNIRLRLQSMASDKGIVDEDIASVTILDEKRNLGREIKQLGQ